MAENSTIARPYAQAAFDLANEQGKLKDWSDMLQLLATIANDKAVKSLIGNPAVENDDLVKFFTDVAGSNINESATNLLKVLAENKRLNVLTEVAQQFEEQRAEAEKTVEATVTTAYSMTDAQKQAIADALKKRTGREVTISNNVDESILGGAVIRAGDLVIDASVTGQLDKLANKLMH